MNETCTIDRCEPASDENPERIMMSSNDLVITCSQCGKGMLVAREHVYVPVGCPTCGVALEPWRAPGVPPPPAPVKPPSKEGLSTRSRTTAGWLGVFLGWIGVHRLYLGYTGLGVLQIILTFASGGIGAIWGFIEGILCLCGQGIDKDVDGLPLRD